MFTNIFSIDTKTNIEKRTIPDESANINDT